jgi:hypothetical protein
MVTINNMVIMGNIYDPDTDCQFVLCKVSAKEWDEYQKELEKEEEQYET